MFTSLCPSNIARFFFIGIFLFFCFLTKDNICIIIIIGSVFCSIVLTCLPSLSLSRFSILGSLSLHSRTYINVFFPLNSIFFCFGSIHNAQIIIGDRVIVSIVIVVVVCLFVVCYPRYLNIE